MLAKMGGVFTMKIIPLVDNCWTSLYRLIDIVSWLPRSLGVQRSRPWISANENIWRYVSSSMLMAIEMPIQFQDESVSVSPCRVPQRPCTRVDRRAYERRLFGSVPSRISPSLFLARLPARSAETALPGPALSILTLRLPYIYLNYSLRRDP